MTKMYSILFLVMLTMGAANSVFSASRLQSSHYRMVPTPAKSLKSYEPVPLGDDVRPPSLYERSMDPLPE